jgi:hypothetical protein
MRSKRHTVPTPAGTDEVVKLLIAMHKDAVRRFKRAHEELEDAVDLAIALKERIEALRASSEAV